MEEIRLFVATVKVDMGKEEIHLSIDRAFREDELDEAQRTGKEFKTIIARGISSMYPFDAFQKLEEALNALEIAEHCTLSSTPTKIRETLDDKEGIYTSQFLVMARENKKPIPSKRSR